MAIAIRTYDTDEEAHLTVGTLGKEAGYSPRTTQEAVIKLEEMGLITVRRGWGRGAYNIYEMVLEKVRNLHPYDAPEQKNLVDEKGAKSSVKGAKSSVKGAKSAPYNINNINNKRVTHAHARKMPPRTGPHGPAAKHQKRRKKEPAVNRGAATGGVMPKFSEATSSEAREMWSNCLQGKTADFRIPESATLGPIEGGTAKIFDLTPFQQDQIAQNGRVEIVTKLSRLTGDKINLVMMEKAS
ncbi:hypothetical protein [Kordiimonas aquimaris]|uniref:hypothetical protein n=1 Tax=Kordiimonas aquimaris TaxID=707591 RepID=UPI0021D3B851|nr:hypothetical protein [Kordiimonas aquimaris]